MTSPTDASAAATIDIAIENVAFHCRHGVFDQERTVGADYAVTLRVSVACTAAMHADSLEGTVNYADLYALCKQQMEIPSRLIEHVALRIAAEVKRRFPQVVSGSLRVEKLHPPIAGFDGSASVALTF